MNIILGASGQIGSTLVSELKKKGQPVRAVVRDVRRFTERAVETRQADMFNAEELRQDNKQIYELEGSELYSPADIAGTFSRLLNRPVRVEPIPKHRWLDTLLAVGFTENTAQHLVDMTQAVIENRLSPEHPEKTIKLQTTFGKYLQQYVPLPRSNE